MLQVGSIIISDDYFGYRGSLNKGEAGAFEEFKQNNPGIGFRRVYCFTSVKQ